MYSAVIAVVEISVCLSVCTSVSRWYCVITISVCKQPPRSTQPGHPLMGRRNTGDNWDTNRHTARCTSPVSMSHKLGSAWGLSKQRSAPAYQPCCLGWTWRLLLTSGAWEPWGQGGQMTPPEIFLGGQTWYFDPTDFFVEKKYTPIRCYCGYIVFRLYSETIWECVFVIIYNRFVDSSKCGPRDFDPPPVKK